MTGAQAVPGALLTGAAGWLFVVFAVLALGMAIAVVVARNPIHSALFLLSSFLLVACIFILQQAEFVGAVQILVYAGGIMVLFLFVIMLVHQRGVRERLTFQHQWDVALLFLLVFLLPFLYVLWTERFPDLPRAAGEGCVQAVESRDRSSAASADTAFAPTRRRPLSTGSRRSKRRLAPATNIEADHAEE